MLAGGESCCIGGEGRRGHTAPMQTVQAARGPRPARVIRLGGGAVLVDTDRPLLPQDGEGPARWVSLQPFAIDPFAVTNAWFADFVAVTGHVTEAERFGWSLVFAGFAPERAPRQVWWPRVEGATWRQPEGPASDIAARPAHPVVHVSWNDASAFATWAGGRLPSEAEWEYAAAAGRHGARYPWGEDDPDDTGFLPCNIWQGRFPGHNTQADGFAGTAPVDAFAPNGFGLFNMVGNCWEWCADAFRIRSLSRAA